MCRGVSTAFLKGFLGRVSDAEGLFKMLWCLYHNPSGGSGDSPDSWTGLRMSSKALEGLPVVRCSRGPPMGPRKFDGSLRNLGMCRGL